MNLSTYIHLIGIHAAVKRFGFNERTLYRFRDDNTIPSKPRVKVILERSPVTALGIFNLEDSQQERDARRELAKRAAASQTDADRVAA